MSKLRIVLAQVNPTVGDLDGNLEIMLGCLKEAESVGADIIAFPELMVTGYPPEDLLLKKSFVSANLETTDRIAAATGSALAIVGFVDQVGPDLYNAAAAMSGGRTLGIYHKQHLPNYGVFDEKRYFREGEGILLARVKGILVGLTVCEDLWIASGPHAACAAAGAKMIVNINASPYHMGKAKLREDLLRTRATSTGLPFAYVNVVGGQDEVVFDGQSMIVSGGGEVLCRGSQFQEEMLMFDLETEALQGLPQADAVNQAIKIVDVPGRSAASTLPSAPRIASQLGPEAEAYAALVLGVRDYIHKNGLSSAIVGISGGIDSALTATIACDAIGPTNVLGISNPSEYTSERSVRDAATLAKSLNMELVTLPIGDAYEAMMKILDPVIGGTEPDITEENLQARLRGTLWMAISNKTARSIVLAAGNKSEMSVGYATLYGDMAGALAVLKDVPKTLVFRLARWRNLVRESIPISIIERPPSAELRHDQLDTDSLPPYDILDAILEMYVEDDASIDEIAARGFDKDTVKKVVGLVDLAEYKRRQAPPGIKITERAFGRDRRLPITNRFRPYSKWA